MTRYGAILVALASTLTSVLASAASSIVVTEGWSRPASGTAVVYATIANGDEHADRLIAASSAVCRRVEFHKSAASAIPMGSMNGMRMHGEMMSMQSLANIEIPAHGKRVLAPGGYHLMLVDLRHDLKAGQTVPLRLHFARGGWISVAVAVRGT
jgi:copper(I)-binding protein